MSTEQCACGATRDSNMRSCVDVELEDGIAWVYLNRSEQNNALNPELNRQIGTVLHELEADERCRVLILGGRGKAFSCGLDVSEYFHESDALSATQIERLRNSALAWQRHLMYFGKPTIAMVHGACFGTAFTPVISCDIAVAAEEALFGLSEVSLGTIPAGYVTKAISVRLRHADALYYIMTGSSFSGRKAAEMGLVSMAVRRRALRTRTRQLARLLLTKNLTALNAAKLAYKHVRDMPWEAADDYLYAKAVQAKMMEVSVPLAGDPMPAKFNSDPSIPGRRSRSKSPVNVC